MYKFIKAVFPDFNELLAFLAVFVVGAPLPILSKLFKKELADLDAIAVAIGTAALTLRTDEELFKQLYLTYDVKWEGREAHRLKTEAALIAMKDKVAQACDCPRCTARKAGMTAERAGGTAH